MEITLNEIKPNRFLLAKKLRNLLQASLAIEPILIHLFAILLGIGVLILLNHPSLFPNLGKYHRYFTYSVYALILLQTLKSATKSLGISVLAISLAGLGMALLSLYPTCTGISIEVLKTMMLFGTIGIGVSIFVMR